MAPIRCMNYLPFLPAGNIFEETLCPALADTTGYMKRMRLVPTSGPATPMDPGDAKALSLSL